MKLRVRVLRSIGIGALSLLPTVFVAHPADATGRQPQRPNAQGPSSAGSAPAARPSSPQAPATPQAEETPPASTQPRREIIPFPVLISDPTNGVGGGGGILALYRLNETALRDSQTAVVGYYTSTASWRFALQQILSFDEDRFRSETTVIAGTTNNAFEYPDLPSEVAYGERKSSLETNFMVDVWRGVFVGVSYLYRDTRYTFDRGTGAVQQFSRELLDEVDAVETLDSGLGMVVSFDSRDEQYAPTRGFFTEMELLNFNGALGSDHDYRSVDSFVNGYQTITGEHVLAFRVRWRNAFGDVPFAGQSTFGGVDLRAYPTGKYRGRGMVAGQAEYRFPIWKRLRGVAFGGTGRVYGLELTLGAEEVLPSGGGGIRFLLLEDRGLVVGLDVAFGRFDNKGVYFSFGEAF